MEEKRQVVEDGDEDVALGHVVQRRGALDRDIPLLWEVREEEGWRVRCVKEESFLGGGEGERVTHTSAICKAHINHSLLSENSWFFLCARQ